LESYLDPSLERVIGDPDRLQQIVWNLLTNAIKFTPEEGKIEVRSLQVGSRVHIQVKDTGIGIQPEFIPFVFDRFRQADSSTTRAHGGLGLGLAIVRHLVELHHGKIYVESEGEGKGATFTLELLLSNTSPSKLSSFKQRIVMAEDDASRREIDVESSNTLSGLQILLVDDEQDVREVLTTVMEGSGAKVIAASSVQEALQVLDQMQPDVLVSDIAMPQQDGYMLIRQVRERETRQGGCLPALALTAYVREEDCQQALKSGFQRHMSKPVDTTELVMTVANLTGRAVTQEV
jgi:CheY-like chemotaxis protein/anti-sigma regulatory factor (Ser/Thr protein kinase)